MVQQAEISTEDFIRRCNHELGMWYGVVEDGIRATYTPERLARLNIDGTDHLIELWGESLPYFDYVITETPDFTGLDELKQKSWDSAMAAVAQFGPGVLEVWGQFHNTPRSVIRGIQKFLESQQAPTGEAPGVQGMPSPPGMAVPGGPGAPPVNNGATPAGMAPAAVA